ncbi:G protein signaling modulator 3 [Homo sapiens]|uniref:G protein signaling modulator 3 n=1 Tax=Homo sapiens TaxID=9606 RepID=Q9Y4H5_HUMAN|nr:G protein signaling modulator 3 [Homo sapiens]KAI4017776.1 G protein signaling modulator 3 [Homo sapiens]CAB51287.1 G18.1a protein [Homo sapiens]
MYIFESSTSLDLNPPLPTGTMPLPVPFLPSRGWRLRDPRKKRMVSRAPLRMRKAGPLQTPPLGLGDLLLHPLLLQGPATQPWDPARPPCSPCRLNSFWTWWLKPSPAAWRSRGPPSTPPKTPQA